VLLVGWCLSSRAFLLIDPQKEVADRAFGAHDELSGSSIGAQSSPGNRVLAWRLCTIDPRDAAWVVLRYFVHECSQD